MDVTMRLFAWWPRSKAASPRSAFSAEPFTTEIIARVPASRGIYRLYQEGEVIYAGLATDSLRRELESHRRGERGDCTRGASGFLFEVTPNPESALRDYLVTYMARNGARLPPCNQLRQRKIADEGLWPKHARRF